MARSLLLGVLVGLFPVVVLLVATHDVVPSESIAAESAGDPTGEEQTSLFAGARAEARPARSGPSSGPWVHGLPLLPRLSARPAPEAAEPESEPVEEPELSPEQAAEVEVAAEAQQAPAPRPGGTLGAAVPASVRRWESLIVKSAERYRLDPNLLAALIMTESGGNPQALSPKGAVGLTQLVGGSYDPETNVRQGAEILARHLDRYRKLDLALAAYNAGPASVDRYGDVPPFRETRDHVFRVLLRLELYAAR